MHNRIKELYDPAFPGYTDGLRFLEELLDWLEIRKSKTEQPWERGEFRHEIKDEDIIELLNVFKSTLLDGLCTPNYSDYEARTSIWPRFFKDTFLERHRRAQQKDLDRVVDETVVNVSLLKYFLEYVGMSKSIDNGQWIVQLVRVGPKDGPVVPARFLSWLVVDDKNKTLYILYNKDAISFGTNDAYNVVARSEKIFLHELGHAVNHLDWYREILASGDPTWFMGGTDRYQSKWIGTPAWHEFEAWGYAFAICDCVKSTRSWITRLVEEIDDEWLNL